MSEEKKPSATSSISERRSGKDRRQTDRRDPARNGDDKGILSTRRSNRRKGERREASGNQKNS